MAAQWTTAVRGSRMLHNLNVVKILCAPRVAVTVLALTAVKSGFSSQEGALPTLWRDTAASLFSDAHAGFKLQTSREASLGEALTLLQLQPKTERKIAAATALLEGIIADGTDDEAGINALYFLGRIAQVHRMPVNPSAAVVHYTRLIEAHPSHPLAGQARVKLALIALYRIQSADERATAFARFSALGPDQPDPASRRDLHLLLGEAALRFDLGKSAAFDHFTAAFDAGILRPTLEADTLVRLGELARELQHHDLSRLHYGRFLAEFPRDNRRRMITEALASLPPPASP